MKLKRFVWTWYPTVRATVLTESEGRLVGRRTMNFCMGVKMYWIEKGRSSRVSFGRTLVWDEVKQDADVRSTLSAGCRNQPLVFPVLLQSSPVFGQSPTKLCVVVLGNLKQALQLVHFLPRAS